MRALCIVHTGYEAWIDYGVDFSYLRGSNRVRAYVGACASDAHAMWLADISSFFNLCENSSSPSKEAEKINRAVYICCLYMPRKFTHGCLKVALDNCPTMIP